MATSAANNYQTRLSSPKMIGFYDPTEDEVFVTESAVKAGVTYENTSGTEPLVVLRYLGPDATPGPPDIKFVGGVSCNGGGAGAREPGRGRMTKIGATSAWLALWVAFSCCAGAARAAEPSREPPAEAAVYHEPNRPQFHFTPEKNWLNDPNGLVFFGGEWHLFYQYNPEGIESANKSWGHAVSRDLLRWEHLPVAIRYGDGYEIWSGSAVVDAANTSGFGTKDNPPLVALYTSAGHGGQSQSLAYSTDRGRTWTKYAGNPVLDEKLKDFRDPKIFWHEPTNRWVMAVALSDQKKVRFYGSADLKGWTQLGEFGPAGATTGVWECPDLFEHSVDDPTGGGGATSKKKRWVLTVSVSGGAPAGANGCQYFVGEFDGKTFTSDNPTDKIFWADHGPDYYAPQLWSGVPATDGRRIWIGWMTSFRYAGDEPTKPWRGSLSLPRELRLVETAAGLRLAQSPVRELATLRGKELDESQFAEAGQQLDIELTLDPAADAVLSVCGDDRGHATVIGYDAAKRQLYVDRTKSRPGEPFQKDFPARFTVPVAAEATGASGAGGDIPLRVIVDRTSVEIFGGDGQSVITANTFPSPGADRLSLPPAAKSRRVWKLNSVWKPKE